MAFDLLFKGAIIGAVIGAFVGLMIRRAVKMQRRTW
ncbi:MAG TPA: glycine zipper domain-containing protein [Pyrinomonadaceae bacterium]|nr:glycine zipper domain-containing protein [Pyrinomonadaceae bacterium]